jgi:amino-acid N-acetyltransferase
LLNKIYSNHLIKVKWSFLAMRETGMRIMVDHERRLQTLSCGLPRRYVVPASIAIDIAGITGYCCTMIRKAAIADVRTIQALVNAYADQGQMLPRSLNELYEHLRDFSVFIEQNAIVGVCALHVSWDGLAEVRSLAVRHDRKGTGIGSRLVRTCLDEARQLGADRVFVLTYQEGFFRRLGFFPVDKKDLPHKIWTDCLHCVKFPNCDEAAMMISVAS